MEQLFLQHSSVTPRPNRRNEFSDIILALLVLGTNGNPGICNPLCSSCWSSKYSSSFVTENNPFLYKFQPTNKFF